MVQDWIIDVLKGFGKFFLHPIFYYSIILAFAAGMTRVKRERKDFHVRVYDVFHELRYVFPVSLLVGLIYSVISIGTGFVLPFAAIVVIAVATILLSLPMGFRLLSPAYSIGLSFFFLLFAGYFGWDLPLLDFGAIGQTYLTGIALLLGFLLIAEGIFVYKNGSQNTSPRLRKSPRGLTVGAHQARRLWVVPLFVLVPSGPLTAPFEWWPVIHWGTETYSILLIPFVVGFQLRVQSTLPAIAIKQIGRNVLWLGGIVLLIAAGALWLPMLALIAAAAALLGREIISYRHRIHEQGHPFYFSPKSTGLTVLGVLPGSPADKMALQIGETIQKVNGIEVADEREFYEALQLNRAHCKLAVLDVNGQIRFTQRALYEGEHHELGILFIEKNQRREIDAV
ncbi:PDZ domain-containing protein [Falsibacillus albus]|uniref:PDZ domain-containing protein n=1 Tax=Falsibacillus albus TaxID=2478915 RepID=A0A3L7K0Y6_9BACI|nr:PDZ domain-containing protein [Falsibacillus albus]RLQ96747.1 PDZ domain-containing protein [Falsibacillus albus]